jgi:hypothetical protein
MEGCSDLWRRVARVYRPPLARGRPSHNELQSEDYYALQPSGTAAGDCRRQLDDSSKTGALLRSSPLVRGRVYQGGSGLPG